MSQSRPVSRACNTCKARRIKCDEERPICQRCRRARRECSYVSDFDRVHRDETRRTQQRVNLSSSAAIPVTSASIPGAAPIPTTSTNFTSSNVRHQPAAARAAARRRDENQPPTTTASTVHLTQAPASSSSIGSYSSPSNPYSLPVRSSPGAASSTSTGTDGNMNLLHVYGRGDGASFIHSIPGMATTAFVAGNEVSAEVAHAAGTGSRFFWRGQRQSPSSYYAHVYTPDDFAAGASVVGSSPSPLAPRLSPQGYIYDEDGNEIHTIHRGGGGGGENDVDRPSAALSLPIGELALCYFAANFMLIPQQPFGGSFFEFIVPVLQGQAPDSAIQYALRACAFSALGNRWVSDTVDFHAIGISQYTAALARTTQSLKDPRQKTSDATLAAVLLLGLFESITARKEMFAWRSHIEGAVQIVNNRGPRKIRTRTEKLLFNSVRLQLINHSMTADTPPTYNINWWAGESILDFATTRMQRFLLEVSQLRRELERHIMACAGQQTIAPAQFTMYLLRVKAIDNEMASFLSSLPDSFKPYTVALASDVPGGDYAHADAFPGRVDVYPDLTIAGVWLSIRASRLVMSCFVTRCMALTEGPVFRSSPEYAEEVRRCSALIADIVAAVPYFLGNTPSLQHQPPSSFGSSSSAPSSRFACGDDHGHVMPKVLSGYLLAWPLAGTYTHDYCTPAQRAYMGGRLKYMGNTLGLRYANVCEATPFRYPSMMMYRDRLIISGTPTSSPQAPGSSVGSPPSVGLGRSPASSASPEAS
ncbi:hypothetical protein SEUCBS140593_007936 [Sporothrix eucalyptigena]|uniref:Zn(2)-C6 fungal-type domain-containing protein n=1 Tax=Sporothrix eucalyptigena TaxID=1812306 RepID=A0ABP0CIP9_9PEZI